MQNVSQQMDDLIRQVKTGSAFESLAAAEKLAELSRTRRRMDNEARVDAEAVKPGSDRNSHDRLGASMDQESSFTRLDSQLSEMLDELSTRPTKLRVLKNYLDLRSREIESRLALSRAAGRAAG